MQQQYPMTSKSLFETDGNGSQDHETLYSLSIEFLEAARVLHATPPTRISYSSIIYYLLGHSAELSLKAFLKQRGQSIDELKRIGHNLEELVKQAMKTGLTKNTSLSNVIQLSTTYKDKNFEYRTRKNKNFPQLDLLLKEIEHLQSVVFEHIVLSS